jgi:eukaryotic-like serine/threonine-protein kinase
LALAPGTRLGPYEIVTLLGAGGMGEVYKARDPRLGRDVAIKVLPESVTDDPSRLHRFEQEARAVAALSHANILAIFDVGTAGRPYLVTELLEGETLRAILERGPLSPTRMIELALQLVAGLTAAHDRGIVHRDLKPENVFVTRDHALKILDFGLAKAAEHADAGPGDVDVTRASATMPGVVMGTAAYMSPEQVRGHAADRRSDIFATGAILYEMVTGQRAFQGASPADTMSAVLREQPAHLVLRSGTPPALAGVVRRCLEKDPNDRFQTASDLRLAIGSSSGTHPAAGGPAPEAEEKSVAVLPFANMSGDTEQEYFSDGLTEEITSLLAHVSGLKVIARTSTFAFKGQHTDIRTIAQTLGVTNVLQGSVRRAGTRLRITAQLIAAADGSHLWSARYDRQMDDLFTTQDEIAGAIAAELKLKFAQGTAAHPRRQPDLNAYDAYLRYLHYQWGFTEESLRRSRECLEQAIALDPEFALPYAGLADHHLASTVANVRADEAMPRARELAHEALKRDPDLPEAHGMLGIVAGPYERDWKEAERRFCLAMAREPVPWHVRQWHAYFYLFPVGRFEEALQQAQRTIGDDPLSQVNYMCLGTIAEGLGLENDARAAYDKALELDPQFWWAWARLGVLHAVAGRHVEALACADKALAIFPLSPLSIGLRAGLLRRTGDTQQAEALLARFPPGSYGAPVALTCVHLVCGDIDDAVEWAAKAVDERHPVFIADLIRPYQALFRTSAAWPALLEKLGLAEMAPPGAPSSSPA